MKFAFFINSKGVVCKKKDKLSAYLLTLKGSILIVDDLNLETPLFKGSVKGSTLKGVLKKFDLDEGDSGKIILKRAVNYALKQVENGTYEVPEIGTKLPKVEKVAKVHIPEVVNVPGKVKLSLTADKETKQFKRFKIDKNKVGATGSIYLSKDYPDNIEITIQGEK